ncbi:GNAT family N-acetyltransferase [Amycolatopsis sp. OK19-0408]|uniref:GNAT family N-acetyltransferase n=2 Tax=Amycolatopsis iheyensis TaxID=2945988 RepID=A0A9X2N6V6_9PSEU|nr:GNAT family N-acetyltransferase [Amycolatopsis iheyensis]
MTWTVRVLDPRTDPEPAGWAAFLETQQAPLTWDYGLLGIESRPSRSPYLLTLVSDGAELVAAVLAMVCRPSPSAEPASVGGLARWGPRWLEVQHAWLSCYPAWLFAEALDADARREILRRFEQAACRRTGPGCLGVVYRAVTPDTAGLVAGRGRLVREVLPALVLENTFADLDGWLAALSRNRRSSLRGQLRKIAADPDVVVRAGTARDDLDPAELAAMLHAHRESKGPVRLDRRGPVTAEYLGALVRRPDVVTTTYHDAAGRLLAFTDLLDHPVTPLHQHWAALPPGGGRPKHLYFDVVVRGVRHMIERRRKFLALGRGATELKVSLGFSPSPVFGAVVPRPVTRW